MIPSSATVRDRNVRIGLLALGGIAVAWPVLPVHPGFACPLRSTTGIPCPLCGATRAVVAAAHGHIFQSLAFNPIGVPLMVLAVYAVFRPSVLRINPPVWAVLLVLGGLWIWNIGFNPTFNQLLLR